MLWFNIACSSFLQLQYATDFPSCLIGLIPDLVLCYCTRFHTKCLRLYCALWDAFRPTTVVKGDYCSHYQLKPVGSFLFDL